MEKQTHPIWAPGEYKYPLSVGFEPFIVSYIHTSPDLHPAMVVVTG